MASAEQKITTAGSNGITKHSNSNSTALSTNTNTNTDPTEQPKDAKDLLPHLESLERIIKLPVVNAAWDKSQDVYGKVKGKQRGKAETVREGEWERNETRLSC